MSDQTVALTIRNQIGVWAFAEVGARDFSYDDTSLYFTAKPTRRLVKIKVTLDPNDTYSIHTASMKLVEAGIWTKLADGIYNDMLAGVIRDLSKTL